MKPWLRYTLVGVAILALAYGAFAAYASYSNGNDVDVVLVVGTDDHGRMYLRCESIKGQGASCSGSDQATVSVHKRDRVHLTVKNADGGSHTHDFNVLGWQYFAWPASPEMELESPTQEWTFTAWAAGSYEMICELQGHKDAGMRGTFEVKE